MDGLIIYGHDVKMIEVIGFNLELLQKYIW